MTSVRAVATIGSIRATTDAWRRERRSIGLVPTMGAIHEGHLSLVEAAREGNDRVVVSVFVNPLQFGPDEDFSRYPRQLAADLQLLADVDPELVVFNPAPAEMYPPHSTTRVKVRSLEDSLEGAHRPGHFEGVATVVTKLFNAVRPDRAYFGQKDAQQVAVVSRLVKDLDMGLEIIACPIVRDLDGLALSSRNGYLDTAQRRAAGTLFSALEAANQAHLSGLRSPPELREVMLDRLRAEPLAAVDYVELVDPATFESPGRLGVIAARIGAVRLIDNHLLGEPLIPGRIRGRIRSRPLVQ